jgi:hypothetical protein
MNESKEQKFRRLAKLRGERILKDIILLGNLSNRNNYSYSEQEVSKIFDAFEEEIAAAKTRFRRKKKRSIDF